jgi:hypothetical protein
MPAGMSTPALGYGAFVAVKLVGYWGAAHFLNRDYVQSVNPWAFGVARTLLGMAVGGALFLFMGANQIEPWAMYVLLVPIRMVEWAVVIVAFYDRRLADTGRLLKCCTLGTVWSFVLDIPAAVLGFIGAGVWIC